MMVTKSEW